MFDKDDNSLTFQNISQTMRLNKDKKSQLCQQHPDRLAKYRSKHTSELLCVSCAIREASRGVPIQDISKTQERVSSHSGFTLLQEVYQQSQQQLQEGIKQYNDQYQKLLDALTDMQIRDLITFNRKLEENHSVYKRMTEEMSSNWERRALTNIFSVVASQPILNHITQVIDQVSSFQTRNQQKSFSRMTSKIGSPLPPSKNASPQPLSKNRSQEILQQEYTLNISNNSFQGQKSRSKEIRQSFTKSQPNTGSFQSKTSTIEELKKSALEDTPESIKCGVSQGGLRLPKEAAVTMFQKVDICESINMGGQQKVGSSFEVESVASLKRKNRYQDGDEL